MHQSKEPDVLAIMEPPSASPDAGGRAERKERGGVPSINARRGRDAAAYRGGPILPDKWAKGGNVEGATLHKGPAWTSVQHGAPAEQNWMGKQP